MFLPTSPEASADSLHVGSASLCLDWLCLTNFWQNYDILEQVGHGGTSVVYLATCKRGRMRNRLVALKKVTW